MGKKIEKAFGKEKENKTSAAVPELTEDATSDQPYLCTGVFATDFTELCRRNQLAVIPPVVPRPRPPSATPTAPVVEEKAKPNKAGKKEEKAAPPPPEIDPDTLLNQEPPEPPPKTYTTKEYFEYFKPCVQVEMESPEAVTEIYIRGWKVDEMMMGTLKECLPLVTKLTTINLWRAGLTDDTLRMLASILPDCPSIKMLVLDNNPVPGEHWHLLIKDDSPVQHLSLRYNDITDVGAKHLGSALGVVGRTNQKLLTLNLTNNKIADEGAKYLADGLRLNRCLLSLDLSSNQITDEGTSKLAVVISRFPMTHEEIVARRRLLSTNIDRKSARSSSAGTSKRAESRDRPGSVRSNTAAAAATTKGGKPVKPAPGGTKKDAKGKEKEEDPKAKKTKEAPEKPKKASSNAEAAKLTSSKKVEKTKGKKNIPVAEPELVNPLAVDMMENINPLLEPVEPLEGGVLLMKGNMALLGLNLDNNKITEDGLEAMLKAMSYQTTICQLQTTKTSCNGLLRLGLRKNKCIDTKGQNWNQLMYLMACRDPVTKSSTQLTPSNSQETALQT